MALADARGKVGHFFSVNPDSDFSLNQSWRIPIGIQHFHADTFYKQLSVVSCLLAIFVRANLIRQVIQLQEWKTEEIQVIKFNLINAWWVQSIMMSTCNSAISSLLSRCLYKLVKKSSHLRHKIYKRIYYKHYQTQTNIYNFFVFGEQWK